MSLRNSTHEYMLRTVLNKFYVLDIFNEKFVITPVRRCSQITVSIGGRDFFVRFTHVRDKWMPEASP